MLLKLDTVPIMPRLKTASTGAKPRLVVDDTLEVTRRMDELFSGYNWKTVTTEKDLLTYLSTSSEFGLDCETTGLDVFKDELCGFSLGTTDSCIYVPLKHKIGENFKGNLSAIADVLKTKKIYGFNAKFDIKFIWHHLGLKIEAAWCGFLAARLMNSLEPSNELKELYVKYIDNNEKFYSFRELFRRSFSSYDPAIVGAYAAVDAIKHIRLGKWQEQNIDKSARKLLEQLELPLTHALVDVELTGIELDLVWSKELVSILEKDLRLAEDSIASEYQGLNPGSPKQVAEWLYDKLKLPQLFGRGTGEGVLKLLDHPLPEKILEYRHAQKLLSTYASKMPETADNGIIHCTFNQYGADTGRFSSSNPNLQNIPRDNRFRKMFKAREGCKLVSCDYTQQEVYIMAAMADDAVMKEAYAKGMDFYGYMASIVFDKPYDTCLKHKENAQLREQMKSIVLALNYDKGIKSLAKDIKKSVEETRKIYGMFFERCPKVKTFRQERLEFARKNGYVETILGRKRYFSALSKPDFECENKDVLDTVSNLRSDAIISKLIVDANKEGIKVVDNRKRKVVETRQVVNSIIQGSAADMTKLAMLTAYRDKRLKELGMKILLQVHDEIIAEFPTEHAEEGGNLLAQLMIDVGSDLIGIRMKCEPTIMEHWEKD